MKAAPTIVDWLEQNKVVGRPLPISDPSKTWIDRMWHALLDETLSEQTLDELERLFFAYIDRLEGEELDLTTAAWTMLLAILEKVGDDWPRCVDCGNLICPHCGEKYRDQGGRG